MKKEYRLDQIDREIIWALDENARYSATKISQLIGYSKQRVAFRIRRMIRLGILELFSAIINKSKLGYFHCQIYLKFKKRLQKKEILDKLKKIPSLHWEGTTEGIYDLVIFILIKSLEECWRVYQKIIEQFSDILIKKEILLSSSTFHSNHAYITGVPKKIDISEFPHREIKIKQRDLDLINAIKEQGRIQIKKLAKKIKMTPYTIRQRIAYLKRRGIIQGFKIRINYNLLGFRHYMILINLTGIDGSQRKQLIQNLIETKETLRIIESIGKWDLVCDIVLPAKENPSNWLKSFFIKEDLPKIKANILKVKEVLPINTVAYY